MRSRLVLKLFLLTSVLCSLILASVYVGQTIFFKTYYVSQKVKDIEKSLEGYKEQYEGGSSDADDMQSNGQEFYRDHNAWLVYLDQDGNLIQADDYYLQITGIDVNNRSISYKVPLYHLVKSDEENAFKQFLKDQQSFWIYGIAKGPTLIPAAITTGNRGDGAQAATFANPLLKRKMDEHVSGRLQKSPEFSGSKAELYDPFTYMYGKIVKAQVSDLDDASGLIHANPLLLDRINVFQTDLLLNDTGASTRLETQDYEQANVHYKLFVKPLRKADGSSGYLFAMASLQPVNEAVEMVQNYYVYMIAFVMLLVLLASLYYAIGLTRPLLRINRMTKKLAALDFSESIPVTSKDEIGDLSGNINKLSQTLHSHIRQLQSDIEKERRLENTRKEFISGVSHELKTPLSVMKSCLSILKDGVAINKKDYYFAAMEKEVDKMDALIVGMLELAKYESGTYRMEMETFRVDAVIEEVCHLFEEEIEGKRQSLRLQLAAVKAAGNRLRIEQVVTNFVANAIRYTPEGETINVTAGEETGRIAVRVENTGVRIPEEQLDKVWDRFYRGDASRERSEGGSGLGLAISKNILELHEAEYGAANMPNGVVFYFYLNKVD
ncbi:HAMP domain-containing protein [Paenibacillus sp. MWE-103]|uniref:histidine kinase n=1 Tax=Paenibacillus artemisiicola TaxID=1172618 RepID=A0ABS3W458_9BACL|nr:HAMP domain-containing sensor histidine kinase [Paenibacillus artemisiicola]MBO7743086.1 HAMP domain-containing protein [Paenibacillus artemisiicola]